MVIDASVAVKWVVPEVGSEAAIVLLGRELWAPSLWLAEAANALLKKSRRGEITEDEARLRAQDLADAPIEPIELPILLPSALRMAGEAWPLHLRLLLSGGGVAAGYRLW